MKYFEKGQTYTYEEIEKFLKDAKEYVVKDLKESNTQEEFDELSKVLFELQTYSILSLYQCLLLNGKEEK